jgi:hypothetical protein
MIDPAADRRAARAGHPDAVAVEAAVQVAASLVLLEESVESGEQHHAGLVASTFITSCAAHVGVRSHAVPPTMEWAMPTGKKFVRQSRAA